MTFNCITREAIMAYQEFGFFQVYIPSTHLALVVCPLCGHLDGGMEHWQGHGEEADAMEREWFFEEPVFGFVDDMEEEDE